MAQRHRRPRSCAPSRSLLRPTAQAVMAALALQLAGTAVAWAQAGPAGAAVATQRDIPAGPLGRTLSLYAAQAGIVLSFDAALTDGLASRGLSGRYTVQQGFDTLLAGTGLEALRAADGSYALRRTPAATR